MTAGSLVVRLDPALWAFLPRERRAPSWTVPWDGDATVGHVVQSLGVPLTEVGALHLDGTPVLPARRPIPGGELVIRPVPRPQEVPGATGFLLDVGLGTLARRLRVLGIDAAYRNDTTDAELVREGAAERRVVLTQDRGLLMRRALWAGAHVRGHRPDDQLADVLDRFAPALAPSTRCTVCNGELAARCTGPGRARFARASARRHPRWRGRPCRPWSRPPSCLVRGRQSCYPARRTSKQKRGRQRPARRQHHMG